MVSGQRLNETVRLSGGARAVGRAGVLCPGRVNQTEVCKSPLCGARPAGRGRDARMRRWKTNATCRRWAWGLVTTGRVFERDRDPMTGRRILGPWARGGADIQG